MKQNLKSFFLYASLLWLGIVLVSCEAATADGGGADPPGNPIGIYEPIYYERFQVPVSGGCCLEELITDCDLNSTFEFTSNGKIVFNDYGVNSDCSDSELLTGTYTNEAYCCNSVYGDFQLNELFRGEIIYNAIYGNGDMLGDLSIRFTTVSEGIQYNHYMSLDKVN
ncbi:hypothetical protein [Winogradskyella aurantiaca]|uniref:hypothetical protein n=1 Tax=Winogradskyella aurantiaca TaxID=2219558 RepID=UPI000E1D09FC|nr:hypothetical protein [Winogradskyella aurantiaca]